MAKHKGRQLTDYEDATKTFWQQQRGVLGSQAIFIDTCAILAYFVHSDNLFRPFIEKEILGYRIYTSEFVVGETARRLTKPRANDPFRGPKGEQSTLLALHIVQQWLEAKDIAVMHIPRPVFDHAKLTFATYHWCKGWDVVDAVSCEIIRGMGGDRIISGDRGFREAGLLLAPSDAYERYERCPWLE